LKLKRVTTAYNLVEINDEEYVKICSPLQAKLSSLKNRLQELEEIFDFSKEALRNNIRIKRHAKHGADMPLQ
jgi:hypothetical protein